MRTIERGSIFTIAAKGAYTGKPRPALVVQTEAMPLDSVIVIPFTTDFVEAPSIRIELKPSPMNGLKEISWAMCDKISTIPVANLKELIGHAASTDMRKIGIALLAILAITD